jgi:hypothetical protein
MIDDSAARDADQDRSESHALYASFEITEVATPCNLFADILGMTAKLRLAAVASTA